MNAQAFLILLIPALGHFSILRGGRWHWDPIGPGSAAVLHTPFRHRLFVAMFWLGWSTSLVVGTLMRFGL
jgi:hypothetical protein